MQALDVVLAVLSAVFDYFPDPDEAAGVSPSSGGGGKGAEAWRPWTWKEVDEVAAVAGLDPDRHTLRRIVRMAEIKERIAWNHTAWLCLHIPKFSKKTFSFEDFHPLIREQTKGNISLLRRLAEEIDLPEKLSEEEKRARFEKWKGKA